MSGIEVRYATEADTEAITSIRRRAGCRVSGVKEERFLMAEERGEVLAAVRYRRARGGIVLDGVVADPRVEELRFATALYCGAGELARAAGLRLVWAECDAHRELGLRRLSGHS